MSALTKIAVVLLVVASLLLSAGVVVFVNKVDNFQTTAKAAGDQLAKERTSHNDTKVQLEAANTALLSTSKDLNARMDALKTESASKDAAILEIKGQLATDVDGVLALSGFNR